MKECLGSKICKIEINKYTGNQLKMEEKGKNTGNSKLIIADFKSESKIQAKPPVNTPPNQSNPLLNRLFKLTHTELTKNNDNYKSFSKFKPDDLR